MDGQGREGEGLEADRKPAERQCPPELSKSDAALDSAEHAKIALIAVGGFSNAGGLSVWPAPDEMHASGTKP
jgi:hypothetical protein